MPCGDGGAPYTDWDGINVRRALCGILTLIERTGEDQLKTILDGVDWAEAGVKQSWLIAWWEEHKRQDTERRQRERAAAVEAQLREAALAKLSPEERKLVLNAPWGSR